MPLPDPTLLPDDAAVLKQSVVQLAGELRKANGQLQTPNVPQDSGFEEFRENLPGAVGLSNIGRGTANCPRVPPARDGWFGEREHPP